MMILVVVNASGLLDHIYQSFSGMTSLGDTVPYPGLCWGGAKRRYCLTREGPSEFWEDGNRRVFYLSGEAL